MQIHLVIITCLVGWSLYLWREKKYLARQLLRHGYAISMPQYGRRYKEIFENSSDAIFVIEVTRTGKLRFDSLNPAAVQMIDTEDIGFSGKYLDEIGLQSGDRELQRTLLELSARLGVAIERGLPVKYESTFRLGAEPIPGTYDINLVPMADDRGISHILCFAQDVTARKLYEHELLERASLEEKLSGFAASSPGFFYSFRHGKDGSNAMPFASAGINDLFGLHPEDVAQNISSLSLLIQKNDMKLFFEVTAHSAVHLSPLQIEFRVQHPEKGELWVEARALPQQESDGSVVWHGFMHEVSERKRYEQTLLERAELEQRQSHFFSVAPGFFYTSVRRADSHNSMPFASTGIRDLFGLDPADVEQDSEPFLAMVYHDDREQRLSLIEESARNMTQLHYECRINHPQKGVRWVEAHSLPQPLPDGCIRWDGFMHDITERKQVEMQLQDTQNKLRELVLSREAVREEERKRIAWEMHEELGQLLAAMKMRISGMRTQFPKNVPVLNEDSRVVLELIDKSIKTIHALVSDLRPTVLLHGISISLEWLVAEFNKHPDIVCELAIKEDGGYTSDELTTLVFRVAQESLENIARHAGVSRVLISWEYRQDAYFLTIRHDGHANASDLADEKSLSFFGMQERVTAFGGELRMFSELEHRSVIEARFPVRGMSENQYSLFEGKVG